MTSVVIECVRRRSIYAHLCVSVICVKCVSSQSLFVVTLNALQLLLELDVVRA
jgi:hypothetical protein